MINFVKDEILDIQVKAKSSKSEIFIEDKKNKKEIIVYLKSIPIDGKANEELIRIFKKQLNLKIELISGFKSKKKKIKIL